MREGDEGPVELVVRGEQVGFGALRPESLVPTRRWSNDFRVTRTLKWHFRPLTIDGAESVWGQGFVRTGDHVTFTV